MPLIIATAIGDTPDELYDAGRKADATAADWIEVRLDGPSGLPWDLRAFFSFGKPCIATVRHADDGGRSHADDKTRADILRRAVLAGAKGIDVETWSDEARTLVKEAHAHGVMVIASRHLPDTPGPDRLLNHLHDARALGADHAKLATRIEGPLDAIALVRTAQHARDEGIPYALMALNDPLLRLMARELGMTLVYASVPGATPGAGGQLPVDRVRAGLAQPAGPAIHITAATRFAFLFGHPVSHSKSPAMQNAAFRAAGIDGLYLPLDIEPASLAGALASLRSSASLGCNLTIPLKEAALPFMDALDASARDAGSVNTVVHRDGRLVGHNTDGAGAVDALREAGVELKGRKVLVVGAGGTGRALVAALAAADAQVTVTNRTDERARALAKGAVHATTWEQAIQRLGTYEVVAHATSVGLGSDEAPFDAAALSPQAALLDCVYGDTRLTRIASARGLKVVRGEAMLLHQGARAFTLWTGAPAPLAVMRAALGGAP